MAGPNIQLSEVTIMARKKKEETAEEVKTTKCSTKKPAKIAKNSIYGFYAMQEKAKLHVKGIHDKVN